MYAKTIHGYKLKSQTSKKILVGLTPVQSPLPLGNIFQAKNVSINRKVL